MNFKEVDANTAEELSALASAIVKEHYDPILGSSQNDYMINKFQSAPAIKDQLSHGISYYFVCDDMENKIGFMAFYPRGSELYLSKFYLLSSHRGKGISRHMLRFVIAEARKINAASITLNVNRYNATAIAVYEKLGFHRIREEKIDIGSGYFMDDYVYEYPL